MKMIRSIGLYGALFFLHEWYVLSIQLKGAFDNPYNPFALHPKSGTSTGSSTGAKSGTEPLVGAKSNGTSSTDSTTGAKSGAGSLDGAKSGGKSSTDSTTGAKSGDNAYNPFALHPKSGTSTDSSTGAKSGAGLLAGAKASTASTTGKSLFGGPLGGAKVSTTSTIGAKSSEPSSFEAPTPPASIPETSKSISAAKAVVTFDGAPSTGLDTITITGTGNWLEKRIWFEKAEKAFDTIRKQVSKAVDARVEFVEHMNAINNKIDSFYQKVNFDKGQIDELLQQASKNLTNERTVRGDLSVEETNINAKIHAEKKSLTALGKNIEHVAQFDEQLDKTMGQVFKIIDDCRALETKAWDQFKEIGVEIDDKNARTLYYTIENEEKNIAQNVEYLQKTLMNYFQSTLIGELEQLMTTIMTSIEELHTKGITMSELLSKQQATDEEVAKERITETEENVEEAWKAKEEKSLEKVKVKKQPKTLLSSMTEISRNIICSIPCAICFVKDWIHDEICYWYLYFTGDNKQAMKEYALLAHKHTKEFFAWGYELLLDFVCWLHCAICGAVGFSRDLICNIGCMACSLQCWICSFFEKK